MCKSHQNINNPRYRKVRKQLLSGERGKGYALIVHRKKNHNCLLKSEEYM